MRISDEFLHPRERLSTIDWLAQLWAYHREEMPGLLAERDADADRLSEVELDSPWLLGDHPELDVNLIFHARHPFPAVRRIAHRLNTEHGFIWPYVGAEPPDSNDAPWAVEWFSRPVPDLEGDLVQLWTCEAMLRGPAGFARRFTASAKVNTGYPLYDDDRVAGWDEFLRGQLPCLPAGPWTGAPALLGEGLCTHNLLVDIGHAIKRNQA